jgi:hypothetical protein
MIQPSGRGAGITGWLRRPPTRPAGPELRALFLGVAIDKRFHRVASLGAREIEVLHAQLASAAFCECSIWQGGYAGRPADRGLVLGLSRLHRRIVPAAHELFHLVREVRGRKRLDDETQVWREECMIWFLTWQYAPVRTVLELTGLFVILTAGVYAVLQLAYWMLGLGSVVDYLRQLVR